MSHSVNRSVIIQEKKVRVTCSGPRSRCHSAIMIITDVPLGRGGNLIGVVKLGDERGMALVGCARVGSVSVGCFGMYLAGAACEVAGCHFLFCFSFGGQPTDGGRRPRH